MYVGIFVGGFLLGLVCCPFFLSYVAHIARPVLLRKSDPFHFPFWRMWASKLWSFCINLMEKPLTYDWTDKED